MSAVGRKLTLNFNKLRKKLTDVPSDASQTDQENYLHLPSLGHCDTGTGEGSQGSPREGSQRGGGLASSPKQKSISMCSINRQEGEGIGQDDIMKLTQEVKCFSDALALLKSLFTEAQESGEEVRVLAHERLGEVLNLLKAVLQSYQALNSTDVFSASGTLISKIKNYNYEEEVEEDKRSLCDAIDQLALAFSSSVSEYLMGETEAPEEDVKTKSCDNLASVPGELTEGEFKQGHLSAEDVNMILAQLEAGVDLALQRAKAWSKYSKDVVSYIERKCQFETEYAKNLTRLAQSMKQPLTDEGFLPLQSVYCTSLSQDLEYASTSQATCTLLQTQKFVEPMNHRRAEHDKVRKILKEVWSREMKKMHDAVTNLRKAKTMYIQRHHEYDKAKELAQKTEAEMLNQSGGAALSKIDKRKRLEEDALHRAAEAETTYKACVAEANMRQEEMAKVKKVVLAKLQEEISLSDEMMKKVTMDYFQLQIAVSAPVPVQYQTLCETSHDYEPGSQYAEFVRRLPVSARRVNTELFTFEPYLVDKQHGERKTSNQSNGSGGSEHHSQESSPQSSPRKQQRANPLRAWGHGVVQGSDTDSASSNRSMDNSPNASPRGGGGRHLGHPDDEAEDRLNDSGIGQSVETLVGQGRKTVGGRVGKDADFQGICSRLGTRRNTFGVDFSEQVRQANTDVPPIITLCLDEIERSGMDIRGIYRVSGVKSKVENLCLKFDNDPDGVDLSEENPNVISNVLKLYLRQLPEPLLTFRLYSDFIRIAKEDMAGTVDQASTVERLRGMASRLPKSNFKTSAILMHHLKRMASNVEVNQMSTNNLGIVFGPTLLRPQEGTASLTSLVDTPHQTHTVEMLIKSAEEIFGPEKDHRVLDSLETDDSTITAEASISGDNTGERHQQEVAVRTPSGAAVESVFREASSTDHQEVSQEFSLPGSTSQPCVGSPSPASSSDTGSDERRARVIPVQRVNTLSQPTGRTKGQQLDVQTDPSNPGETSGAAPTVNIIIPVDSVQALREKMKRDLGVASSPPHADSPIHDAALKSPGAMAKMAFLYNTPDTSKPWGPQFPDKAPTLRASHSAPLVTASDPSTKVPVARESSTPVETSKGGNSVEVSKGGNSVEIQKGGNSVEISKGTKPGQPRFSLPVPKPYSSTTVVHPVEMKLGDRPGVPQTARNLQSSGTGPISSVKPPITTIATINVLEPMSEPVRSAAVSSGTEQGPGVGMATYASSVETSAGEPVSYRIPVQYMVTNPPVSAEATQTQRPATEAKTVVLKPVKMSAQELETKFV